MNDKAKRYRCKGGLAQPHFKKLIDRCPSVGWNRLSSLSTKSVRNMYKPVDIYRDEKLFEDNVKRINQNYVEFALMPVFKRYLHDRVLGKPDIEKRLKNGLGSIRAHKFDFSSPKHHDLKELRGLTVNDVNRPARFSTTPFTDFVMKHSSLARHLNSLKKKEEPVIIPTPKVPRRDEANQFEEDILFFETMLKERRLDTFPRKVFRILR